MGQALSMIARALGGVALEPESADRFPVVPGYDLVDRVGRGGMGVVYEAIQRSTGRRCAVKLLCDQDRPGARQRFVREVELASRLEHANIVRIFDAGSLEDSDGPAFYAMEFMDGRPLDRWLEPGRSAPREVAGVLATVCRAVDEAHRRGVLHRDLKPANILVDVCGEPHVLDFGLARPLAHGSGVSISEQGQLVGTLGFLPPEQACGRTGDVGAASDIYALGAIGYYLITGSLPTDTTGSLGEVLQRIERQDPVPPSHVRPETPRDLCAVLLKALDKSPRARYASAAAMAEDLERFLQRRPVLARRVSAAGRAWRLTRRNPVIASVVTAAACLVLAIGAGAFHRVRAERDRASTTAARAAADQSAALEAAMDGLDKLGFDNNDRLAAVPDAHTTREQSLNQAMDCFERLSADGRLFETMPERAAPVLGKLGEWAAECGQAERAASLQALSLTLARRAAERAPDDLGRTRDLAFALWRNGLHDEAAGQFERVLRADPESGRAMVELAIPLKTIAADAATPMPVALESGLRAATLLARAARRPDLDWFSAELIVRMSPGIAEALSRRTDDGVAVMALARIDQSLRGAVARHPGEESHAKRSERMSAIVRQFSQPRVVAATAL